MENLSLFREFAEQCEALAAEAQTEQHRNVLREMAAMWRRLAQALADELN